MGRQPAYLLEMGNCSDAACVFIIEYGQVSWGIYYSMGNCDCPPGYLIRYGYLLEYG